MEIGTRPQYGNRISSPDQMKGHGLTHYAQADKTNALHVYCNYSSTISSKPSTFFRSRELPAKFHRHVLCTFYHESGIRTAGDEAIPEVIIQVIMIDIKQQHTAGFPCFFR